MKLLLVLAALIFTATSAFAANYFYGQCGVGGPFNPYPAGTVGGTAGPSGCYFGSLPVNSTTFSDTETFYLGDWHETYGTWTYTSSTEVTASGRIGITACSGRGCHGTPYSIVIDSATIDGVPLNPPTTGLTWTLPVDLAPGAHVLAVSGTASGATWYATWGGSVQGVMYTLEAPPAPSPCTSECDDTSRR